MFGIPTPTTLYMKLAGIFLVLALVAGAYAYVQILRSENATLAEQHINDGMIIDSYKVVVEQNDKDNKKQQQLNKDLSKKWQTAIQEKADLSKRLSELSFSPMNAKMTETTINQISKDSMRCNELVTGAKIVDTDATNSVCPDIVSKVKTK